MTELDIDWTTIDNISIRDVASKCGYDITSSKKAREDALKPTVQSIILLFDKAWERKHQNLLKSEKECLYVISLDGGMAIDYAGDLSPILYIGRGNARNRLRSHLKEWLITLSNELEDVTLTFYLSRHKYYKEAEALLLEAYFERYSILPLWNDNWGNSSNAKYTLSDDSLKPILSKNKRYKWSLHPLSSSKFKGRAGERIKASPQTT